MFGVQAMTGCRMYEKENVFNQKNNPEADYEVNFNLARCEKTHQNN